MTGWGEFGSASDHERYVVASPRLRRRCHCGCGGRATHTGMANGVALMTGCHLACLQWRRDPNWLARAHA